MSSILDALNKLEQERAAQQSEDTAYVLPATPEQAAAELIGDSDSHSAPGRASRWLPVGVALLAGFVLASVLAVFLLRDSEKDSVPGPIATAPAAPVHTYSMPAVMNQNAGQPVVTPVPAAAAVPEQPIPVVSQPVIEKAADPPTSPENSKPAPVAPPMPVQAPPEAAKPVETPVVAAQPTPKPAPPAPPAPVIQQQSPPLPQSFPAPEVSVPEPTADAPVPAAKETQVAVEPEPVRETPAAVPPPLPPVPEPPAPAPVESAPVVQELPAPAVPAAAPPPAQPERTVVAQAAPPSRAPVVVPPPKPRASDTAVDFDSLPRLSSQERAGLGLDGLRLNVLRPAGKDQPDALAIINLKKVYVGESIPGTRARLIAVEPAGIAIEIESEGMNKRFRIPR